MAFDPSKDETLTTIGSVGDATKPGTLVVEIKRYNGGAAKLNIGRTYMYGDELRQKNPGRLSEAEAIALAKMPIEDAFKNLTEKN